MKKVILLVLAAVLSVGGVNAKLIFQESFDGKNGTVGQLSAGATNSDDFFNGSSYEQTRWWTALGASNYIQVAEGSLSYDGYQTEGLGNKAYLWSSGADDIRSFASSAVTSGKVYLAAIINVETLKANASPDYFISLCDHANGYYLGRIYAKSIKDGDNWVGYKLGVAKANDGENYLRYTDEVFTVNSNVLVVIEYEFVAGEKNDIVRLYVNPAKETSAATLVCVQDTVTGGGVAKGAGTQADPGTNGLFGVMLRQGSYTPKMYVDEIKVATAWDDLWAESEGEQEEAKAEVENIAALKSGEAYKAVLLKSEPVVVYNFSGDLAVQDETGAVIIDDFFDSHLLSNAKVGDKLNNLTLAIIDSKDFINGLSTARLYAKTTPAIVSSGNSVEAFEVTLDEAAKYGAAWIKVDNVEFATALKQFADGLVGIKQGEASADIVVPSGCNIIGEVIPVSASVTGVVTNNKDGVRIRISESANISNRIMAGEATGIDAVSSERAAVKIVRDGKILIMRDGKNYSVTGVEIR